MMPKAFGNPDIKRPNVAGSFYTADKNALARQIDAFVRQAPVEPYQRPVDVLISPHAGYVYSGGVAAYGFKAVSRHTYNTIVVIAPRHRLDFNGVAVWPKGGFQTPLGVVPVDEDFSKQLISASDRFIFSPRSFDQEHALEVQIPFLQKTFKNFKIVPVLMGRVSFTDCEVLAAALNEITAGRDDVLVVASTDMSHYHPDKEARKIDSATLKVIERGDAKDLWNQIAARRLELCGFSSVVASLLYAKARNATAVDVLKYANSGDTSGDYSRVVGYTVIVLYENGVGASLAGARKGRPYVVALSMDQKKRLVQIARETVETYIRTGRKPEFRETDPRLMEEEGAFVTIHKHGRLRGCIGNIIGRGPLHLTVRDMAVESAVRDPRFPKVTKEELDTIDVEVSVLSKPWRVKSADEIVLGKHGVIISRGPRNRGVYLPQVAEETGWSKEQFLSSLSAQKAGLPANAWKDPSTVIEVFTAEVFDEKDVE